MNKNSESHCRKDHEPDNETLIKKNLELERDIIRSREREFKYRNILESIGDHVSIIDKNYTITWANKVAKELYGQEIVGRKCYKVYHGFDKPCEPSPCITMMALIDGKVHNHETVSQDQHGNQIYMNCSANVAVYDDKGNPLEAIEVSSNITRQKLAEQERDKLIIELKEALNNIKVLRGLLPICASCKNIRDDKGYWQNIEEYFNEHSDAKFSHSICPECRKKLYGDIKTDLKECVDPVPKRNR